MIGAIYDCALNPERWADTLARLHGFMGFANASLTLLDVSKGHALLAVNAGFAPEWESRLPEYSADALAMWGGIGQIMAYPLDEPVVLSRVNPRSWDADQRYYHEWAKPQGLFDTMAIGLARDGMNLGNIGFGRHVDQGPIGDRELHLARLVGPHLRRAVTISRLLDLQNVTSASQSAVLDALTTAVFLVGSGQRLLQANKAGRTLLALGEPLRLRGGRLEATGVAGAKALSQGLSAALADQPQPQTVAHGAGENGAMVLHVLPLRLDAARLWQVPGALAAVFVSASNAAPVLPKDLLSTLFNLTPMEITVLEHVLTGRANAEIAAALGVKPSTIKTHLQHLFEKTGTKRQTELVAVARSLFVPVLA